MRDHGLRAGWVACACAQPAQLACAASPLERNDKVADQRAAPVQLAAIFLNIVRDVIRQRPDGKLAHAPLLVCRQSIGDPLFEGGVWLVGAAQFAEHTAEANFFEIRLGSGLRHFIAQLRVQQCQRDQADLGLPAGVVAARPAPRASLRSTSSPIDNRSAALRASISNWNGSPTSLSTSVTRFAARARSAIDPRASVACSLRK